MLPEIAGELEVRPMLEWVHIAAQMVAQAKKEVVIFGGDLSWSKVHEMQDAILEAVGGKRIVRIYFEPDKEESAYDRIGKLREFGAQVEPINVDTGLRMVLIDPDNPSWTRLLVIGQSVVGPSRPKAGSASPLADENMSYSGFVASHDKPRDGFMISATIALYRLNEKFGGYKKFYFGGTGTP